MTESLATITRVISEHHETRVHVRLVGDSISDEEAVSALREARADWIPGRQGAPVDRQQKLQQTLCYVEEGLKNHFAVEETVLPLFMDEMLLRALLLDHRRIADKLANARSTVADMQLEALDREELLVKEAHIRQLVDQLCHLIEDHATREDIVLDMMGRAVQDTQTGARWPPRSVASVR
jgi:hemerythrin